MAYNIRHQLQSLAFLSVVLWLCSSCQNDSTIYAATLRDIPEKNYIYALGKKGEPEAISCKLSRFTHSKSGKSVSVLGMIHMADGSFYNQIHHLTFEHDITLTEGVRGKASISPHHFLVQYISAYFSRINYYNRLVPQNLFLQPGGLERNADVSLQEFSKEGGFFTSFLQLISLPFIIIGGEVNNLALYSKYQLSGAGLSKKFQLKEISNNRKLLFGNMRSVDETDHAILPGIISSRNQKLFTVMNEELKKDQIQSVLIPWGAAHSPDIERELISQGFIKNAPDQWLRAINFHPSQSSEASQFYIPLIAYIYNDPLAYEYSFLFGTIKGSKKRSSTSSSLLWSLLYDKSSSNQHYYFSILPRLFDHPVLFDYSRTQSKKQIRALFFIKFCWE
ncbi:hypothetical protein PQO03_18415 [Lentisphaera profundi]|uniref:Uncharacterized protein n=1 Tax=Lentisphaera profundi TaxID=1658616 RepID=A0ABY7VVK6_9BACT|nr:hypothetical protein [Lentisphaera profundi]WDE97804.1 hypothetical protein PQO03_18415 [Lentisphaera profundi]